MSEYETRVNPTYQSSSTTTTDGSLSIDTTNRSSVTTSNLSSFLLVISVKLFLKLGTASERRTLS